MKNLLIACLVLFSFAETAQAQSANRGRIISYGGTFGTVPTVYTDDNLLVQVNTSNYQHPYEIGLTVKWGTGHYYPDWDFHSIYDSFPWLDLSACDTGSIVEIKYLYNPDGAMLWIAGTDFNEYYWPDGSDFIWYDDFLNNNGAVEEVYTWQCADLFDSMIDLSIAQNCIPTDCLSSGLVTTLSDDYTICSTVTAFPGCILQGAVNYDPNANCPDNDNCQFNFISDGMTLTEGELAVIGPLATTLYSCAPSWSSSSSFSYAYYIDSNGDTQILSDIINLSTYEIGILVEADSSWCPSIEVMLVYDGQGYCDDSITLNYNGPTCVLDCQGIVGGGNLPGQTCDDGNVITQGDVWDDNCNCTGTIIPQLSLQVLLQGPSFIFQTSGVSEPTILLNKHLKDNNLLPLSQPYSVAPFNYQGTESVTTFPFLTVDWVLVELRDATNIDLVVDRRAGLMQIDGDIWSPNGSSALQFPDAVTGESYYIVVRHRNHLAIGSSSPVVLSSFGSYSMIEESSVFGQNQLSPNGRMRTGDVNGDGTINFLDFLAWFSENNAVNTYSNADLNMDGTVNFLDFLEWFSNNNTLGLF